MKIGPGIDPTTEMGPVVSAAQLDRVKHYVAIGQEEGAELVLGGHQVGDRGYFHEPTVFTGVRNDMRIAQEEIFGPVMGILPFPTRTRPTASPTTSATGSPPACGPTTSHRAQRASRALKAGTVWVNTYQMVYPSVPYGGVKLSGHGRTLGATSIEEMTTSRASGSPRLTGGRSDTIHRRASIAAGPARRRRRHLPLRIDDRHARPRRPRACSPTTSGRSTATPNRSPAAPTWPTGSSRPPRTCAGSTTCSACTTPRSTATRPRR